MAAETQPSQFADDKFGWAQRWDMELKCAREALAEFHKQGAEVDAVLRDEKKANGGKRLGLFQSGTKTVGAMMFGRMPQASVSRKFADADDDVARVAADTLERLLNCDIEAPDDTFAEATENNMRDLLGPGLGIQRHLYDFKEGAEGKASEWIDTNYVYWRDFLWGQCHTWSDVPWVAFKAKMSGPAVEKRFGKEIAALVPLSAKGSPDSDKTEEKKSHPWDRAVVWEIWHKESRQVFWIAEGCDRCLDIKDDPLELAGFFPCQRPMMANLTTSKLIPVSDYKYAQYLSSSIDILTTRIDALTKAVRLAGVYNKLAGTDVGKLVQGGENKLYPVDNWDMFAEKGGLKGQIDWLPLEQIVATLTVLRDLRREDIDLLFQVTGQSDVQRGQQTVNGTPGEAQVKAKFGSVRLQALQDELARFASDGQRIRAEIISKHFSPQTIIARSNLERTEDAQYLNEAVALIKSRFADYRIEIKPEAINLTDFAALKEERMEVLREIGAYLNVAMPLAQSLPGSMPFLLKMLKVTVAGLRGGSAYEAIIDQAVKEAEKVAQQPPAPPQPDPKAMAQMATLQMKGQQELAKIQAETQARGVELQMETQAKATQERVQRQENVAEAFQKAALAPAISTKPQPGPAPRGKT
jgi:hypothetical protein